MTEKCKDYLGSNIDIDNVCTLLDQTIAFGEDELKQNCPNVISENTGDVLHTAAFLRVLKIGLKTILGLDKMDVKAKAKCVCVRLRPFQLVLFVGIVLAR